MRSPLASARAELRLPLLREGGHRLRDVARPEASLDLSQLALELRLERRPETGRQQSFRQRQRTGRSCRESLGVLVGVIAEIIVRDYHCDKTDALGFGGIDVATG